MPEIGTLSDWGAAEKAEAELSRFFKPQTNIEYVISFASRELAVRELPVWEKGVMTEKKEPKVILTLRLDLINGQAVNQTWDIIGPKNMEKFKELDKSNTLLTWMFKVKVTEDGKKKELSISPVKPKNGGASPSPSAEEVAEMCEITLIRTNDNSKKLNLVGSDLKDYVLELGKPTTIPKESGQFLVDRGYARMLVKEKACLVSGLSF